MSLENTGPRLIVLGQRKVKGYVTVVGHSSVSRRTGQSRIHRPDKPTTEWLWLGKFLASESPGRWMETGTSCRWQNTGRGPGKRVVSGASDSRERRPSRILVLGAAQFLRGWGTRQASKWGWTSGSQASSISTTQALVRHANSHAHPSPTELETPSNLCLNRPSVILMHAQTWEPLASWLSTGTLEPECQGLNPSSASN